MSGLKDGSQVGLKLGCGGLLGAGEVVGTYGIHEDCQGMPSCQRVKSPISVLWAHASHCFTLGLINLHGH